MKRIITLICLLCVAYLHRSAAQTFATQKAADNDTSREAGYGILHIDNELRALSGTVTVRWFIVDHSTNIDTGGKPWRIDGHCDNVTCWSGTSALYGPPHVTAPYTTSFGIFYSLMSNDNATVGSEAWVRVSVADTTTGSTPKILTFIGRKGTNIGVETTVLEDELLLYPNPARSSIHVSLPGALRAGAVALVSADGKQLTYDTISDKIAEVNLSHLSAGIYFVRLYDAAGLVVAYRRFVHTQ